MVLSDDQLDIKLKRLLCRKPRLTSQPTSQTYTSQKRNGDGNEGGKHLFYSIHFFGFFYFFDNWLALENNLHTTTIPQSFLSFIFVTLGTRQVNCIDEVRCFGLLNAFVWSLIYYWQDNIEISILSWLLAKYAFVGRRPS